MFKTPTGTTAKGLQPISMNEKEWVVRKIVAEMAAPAVEEDEEPEIIIEKRPKKKSGSSKKQLAATAPPTANRPPVRKISKREQKHMQEKLFWLEKKWNENLHIPWTGKPGDVQKKEIGRHHARTPPPGNPANARRTHPSPMDRAASVPPRQHPSLDQRRPGRGGPSPNQRGHLLPLSAQPQTGNAISKKPIPLKAIGDNNVNTAWGSPSPTNSTELSQNNTTANGSPHKQQESASTINDQQPIPINPNRQTEQPATVLQQVNNKPPTPQQQQGTSGLGQQAYQQPKQTVLAQSRQLPPPPQPQPAQLEPQKKGPKGYSDAELERILSEERQRERTRVLMEEQDREQRLLYGFEQELQREREKRLERERELEWEREKFRLQEMERLREDERQKLLDKDLDEARERIRHAERERERAERWTRERERERERELERQREVERQQEREQERRKDFERLKQQNIFKHEQDRKWLHEEEATSRSDIVEKWKEAMDCLQSLSGLQRCDTLQRAVLRAEEEAHRRELVLLASASMSQLSQKTLVLIQLTRGEADHREYLQLQEWNQWKFLYGVLTVQVGEHIRRVGICGEEEQERNRTLVSNHTVAQNLQKQEELQRENDLKLLEQQRAMLHAERQLQFRLASNEIQVQEAENRQSIVTEQYDSLMDLHAKEKQALLDLQQQNATRTIQHLQTESAKELEKKVIEDAKKAAEVLQQQLKRLDEEKDKQQQELSSERREEPTVVDASIFKNPNHDDNHTSAERREEEHIELPKNGAASPDIRQSVHDKERNVRSFPTALSALTAGRPHSTMFTALPALDTINKKQNNVDPTVVNIVPQNNDQEVQPTHRNAAVGTSKPSNDEVNWALRHAKSQSFHAHNTQSMLHTNYNPSSDTFFQPDRDPNPYPQQYIAPSAPAGENHPLMYTQTAPVPGNALRHRSPVRQLLPPSAMGAPEPAGVYGTNAGAFTSAGIQQQPSVGGSGVLQQQYQTVPPSTAQKQISFHQSQPQNSTSPKKQQQMAATGGMAPFPNQYSPSMSGASFMMQQNGSGFPVGTHPQLAAQQQQQSMVFTGNNGSMMIPQPQQGNLHNMGGSMLYQQAHRAITPPPGAGNLPFIMLPISAVDDRSTWLQQFAVPDNEPADPHYTAHERHITNNKAYQSKLFLNIHSHVNGQNWNNN